MKGEKGMNVQNVNEIQFSDDAWKLKVTPRQVSNGYVWVEDPRTAEIKQLKKKLKKVKRDLSAARDLIDCLREQRNKQQEVIHTLFWKPRRARYGCCQRARCRRR